MHAVAACSRRKPPTLFHEFNQSSQHYSVDAHISLSFSILVEVKNIAVKFGHTHKMRVVSAYLLVRSLCLPLDAKERKTCKL